MIGRGGDRIGRFSERPFRFKAFLSFYGLGSASGLESGRNARIVPFRAGFRSPYVSAGLLFSAAEISRKTVLAGFFPVEGGDFRGNKGKP
jgi:hypothetical protein